MNKSFYIFNHFYLHIFFEYFLNFRHFIQLVIKYLANFIIDFYLLHLIFVIKLIKISYFLVLFIHFRTLNLRVTYIFIIFIFTNLHFSLPIKNY